MRQGQAGLSLKPCSDALHGRSLWSASPSSLAQTPQALRTSHFAAGFPYSPIQGRPRAKPGRLIENAGIENEPLTALDPQLRKARPMPVNRYRLAVEIALSLAAPALVVAAVVGALS